jgi:hypothetical protein
LRRCFTILIDSPTERELRNAPRCNSVLAASAQLGESDVAKGQLRSYREKKEAEGGQEQGQGRSRGTGFARFPGYTHAARRVHEASDAGEVGCDRY